MGVGCKKLGNSKTFPNSQKPKLDSKSNEGCVFLQGSPVLPCAEWVEQGFLQSLPLESTMEDYRSSLDFISPNIRNRGMEYTNSVALKLTCHCAAIS